MNISYSVCHFGRKFNEISLKQKGIIHLAIEGAVAHALQLNKTPLIFSIIVIFKNHMLLIPPGVIQCNQHFEWHVERCSKYPEKLSTLKYMQIDGWMFTVNEFVAGERCLTARRANSQSGRNTSHGNTRLPHIPADVPWPCNWRNL